MTGVAVRAARSLFGGDALLADRCWEEVAARTEQHLWQQGCPII